MLECEEVIGPSGVRNAVDTREAAIRFPATRAWEEAQQTARALRIEMDEGDLEMRIRAIVAGMHVTARTSQGERTVCGRDVGALGRTAGAVRTSGRIE